MLSDKKYILGIDSTKPEMHIKLFEFLGNVPQHEVSRSSTMSPKHKHDKMINPLIDEVMGEAGIDYKDINAIAINAGPGGFTGPRVGVAVVRAFALVYNFKIIRVDELNAADVIAKYIAGEFMPANELVPIYDGRYEVSIKTADGIKTFEY